MVLLGWLSPVFALSAEKLQVLISQPPRLQWLEPDAVVPDDIVTPYTPSLTEMTIPSLWWMEEQYGGELLTSWLAAPSNDTLPPRVDLVVNEAVWRTTSYWDRYAFVTLFGRESQQFGYITRVFNEQRPQPRALALYLCESPERAIQGDIEFTNPEAICRVYMDFTGVGAPTNFEQRFRAF